MSRIVTTARVDAGRYVLDPAGDWPGQVLAPGDVVSPGCSIGGFVVVGVGPGGADVARVTAGEKARWKSGERWALAATEHLLVGPVRWAVSAGAARRGLAHADRAPTGPLDAWRLRAGLPREAIRRLPAGEVVEIAHGGANLRLVGTGHGCSVSLATDGSVESLDLEIGPDFEGPFGPEARSVRERSRVARATWAYLREDGWCSRGPVTQVWVWPAVDEARLVARMEKP